MPTLQKGEMCFCGNSYGKYDDYSNTDDCDSSYSCVDKKGICGGNLKNAIYDLHRVPDWKPKCQPGKW